MGNALNMAWAENRLFLVKNSDLVTLGSKANRYKEDVKRKKLDEKKIFDSVTAAAEKYL
jgi:hypothetical protein